MYLVTKMITPEDASKMLEANCANRYVSTTVVNKYARDMQNGDWQPDTSAISFNRDGVLIDGQHRLLAIIKYGLPVMMNIHYDCEATVFDIGKNRTFSDVCTLQGKGRVPNTVAGAVSLYLLIVDKNSHPTSSEKMVVLDEYRTELETAHTISNKAFPNRKVYTRNASCVLAIALALRCGVAENALRDFFEIVATGFYDSAKPGATTAIVFRNYLINPERGRYTVGLRERLERMCELAIQKYVTGQNVKFLRDPKTGFYTSKLLKMMENPSE